MDGKGYLQLWSCFRVCVVVRYPHHNQSLTLPSHPPSLPHNPQEGLGEWQAAVDDYSRAISLWGGGRGEGINPFVLTFRGNALTRLGKYKDALQVRVLLGEGAVGGGWAL